MLVLTAKLNELNDDGLLLARLIRNGRGLTADQIEMDKHSVISLHSTISFSERYKNYDADKKLGKPRELSPEQEKHLENHIRIYTDVDNSLYEFAPVIELYKRGNRCLHCIMSGAARYESPCGQSEHGERLNAGTQADQINRLGTYFKWFMKTGGFSAK